jgi:CRP-like cAMP-binding protein
VRKGSAKVSKNGDARAHVPVPTRAFGLHDHPQAIIIAPDFQKGVQTRIPATTRSLRKGQSLFDEGQPGTRLFEVISGLLIVSKLLPDGRYQLVEIASPGWVCGFSRDGSYDASCQALSPSTVLAYQKVDFDQASLNADRQRLSGQIEKQMCALHDHTLSLGTKDAKERIATLLLRILPRRGVSHCDGPRKPDSAELYRIGERTLHPA